MSHGYIANGIYIYIHLTGNPNSFVLLTLTSHDSKTDHILLNYCRYFKVYSPTDQVQEDKQISSKKKKINAQTWQIIHKLNLNLPTHFYLLLFRTDNGIYIYNLNINAVKKDVSTTAAMVWYKERLQERNDCLFIWCIEENKQKATKRVYIKKRVN